MDWWIVCIMMRPYCVIQTVHLLCMFRQKPLWFQKTSYHDWPPGEPWKISLGCLCTEAAGSLSLLWLGKGLWNNLAIWHHSRPSQDWSQRQTACFCVRIYQGPQNQIQNWEYTLWRILPRGRCSHWWCPRCDMCRTEDQWAALTYCQGHLQSTICGWPGNLLSRALPGHHRETFTAGSKCNTGMGNKEWFQVCSPQM